MGRNNSKENIPEFGIALEVHSTEDMRFKLIGSDFYFTLLISILIRSLGMIVDWKNHKTSRLLLLFRHFPHLALQSGWDTRFFARISFFLLQKPLYRFLRIEYPVNPSRIQPVNFIKMGFSVFSKIQSSLSLSKNFH